MIQNNKKMLFFSSETKGDILFSCDKAKLW